MTGAIGFILTGLFIASFAVTSIKAFTTVPIRKLNYFSVGFGFLAMAMLCWAMAVIFNSSDTTKELVLASDTLLLLGTGCMIQILLNRSELWVTVSLGLVGSLLIGLRAYEYMPTAFVNNGLLYFNLSSGVRTMIIGVFLLFWLPAVITVASYAAKDKKLPKIQNILIASFMTLIVATSLFMIARRSFVIISLFFIISTLFLAMAIVNILIIKIHNSTGAKHAAKSRA